jgi:fructose-1,6-bisphosphatase/inositol monophosphatase family enzyme
MDHPPSVRELIGVPNRDSCRFRNIEIGGGSIGIAMARLWKGEVGAYILDPGMQAPWDIVPVYGISRKLGFVYLAIEPELPLRLAPLEIVPSKEKFVIDRPHMVVHASRMDEIASWVR